MFYLYIQTYNSEAYVERIANFVTNQTYKDFVCIIFDNGSTDGTCEKMQCFAESDKRVIFKSYENKKALMLDCLFPLLFEMSKSGDDLFARVDADDEISPDYIEKLVDYQNKTRADIVCCGCRFVDADTNEEFGGRRVDEDVLISQDEYGLYFSDYYKFIRTHWAKAFSVEVLRRMEKRGLCATSFGVDTIITQEALRNASSMGIMKDVLYTWYRYKKVKVYDLDPERIMSPVVLFSRSLDFLMYKVGSVSKNNVAFLYLTMLGGILEAFYALKGTQGELSEKIDSLYRLLQNYQVRTCFIKNYNSAIAHEISRWLTDIYQSGNEEIKDKICECHTCLRICPLDTSKYKKSMLMDMYVRMDRFWVPVPNQITVKQCVSYIASQNLLLKDRSPEFLLRYSEVVKLLLDEDVENCLLMLENIIQDGEYDEELFLLAKNVAASKEDEMRYIFFEKCLIERYIKSENLQRAKEEIVEWDDILFGDEEFIYLKGLLEESLLCQE